MPLSFGRYVVHDSVADRLGQGTYGVVYRALDPKLNREVAIKILHAESQEKITDSSRFFREARALAALQHPGVVPVYDFGDEEGTFYLVLAYYAGGTLAALLKSRMAAGIGPFSQDETLALLEPICGGLAAAHLHGMIHRDLKPANILLDQHGHPAITDFGLVRMLNDDLAAASLTGTGDVMGTPLYMAPEQWEPESHAITPRADLYSLGCVTYQMLTGKPPFQGTSPVLHSRHLQAPPPRPSEVRRDLPKPWDDAVLCLMAKEPAERFPTADEFFAWLKLALADGTHALPHPARVAAPAAPPDPAATKLGVEPTLRANPPPVAPTPTRVAISGPDPAAFTSLGSDRTSHPTPRAIARPFWLVGGGVGLAAIATLGWFFWPASPHPAPARGPSQPAPRTADAYPTAAPRNRASHPHQPANSLGQPFVALTLLGEPPIDFAVWETRIQDFRAYAEDTPWRDPAAVPRPAAVPTPSWADPGFAAGEDHPVVLVSWEEANSFCRWLTARERESGVLPASLEYRLPREIEWETAAGNARHPWGTNEWPPPPASGNYQTQPDWGWKDGFEATAPVGSFLPNDIGIHDLSGNVREWCLERFDPENPDDRRHAIRGGAYCIGDRAELLTSYRQGKPSTSRDNFTGFRIVRAPLRPGTEK